MSKYIRIYNIDKNDCRFYIKTPFQQEIIAEIKKCYGKKYHPESKEWSLPNQHYAKINITVKEIAANNNMQVLDELCDVKLNHEKFKANIDFEDTNIAVKIDPFINECVLELKTIPFAKFRKENKSWMFSKFSKSDVIKILEKFNFTVCLPQQ